MPLTITQISASRGNFDHEMGEDHWMRSSRAETAGHWTCPLHPLGRWMRPPRGKKLGISKGRGSRVRSSWVQVRDRSACVPYARALLFMLRTRIGVGGLSIQRLIDDVVRFEMGLQEKLEQRDSGAALGRDRSPYHELILPLPPPPSATSKMSRQARVAFGTVSNDTGAAEGPGVGRFSFPWHRSPLQLVSLPMARSLDRLAG